MPPSPPPPPRRPAALARQGWPHVRALLVLAHLLAILAVAVPAPAGGMRRTAWKAPTVQAELPAWATRFRSAGVEVSDAEFEDRLWRFASRYMDVRGGLLDPLRPYYRYAGTSQSWRMFVAPHRHPSRLEVAVKQGADWEVVYLQARPGADWMQPVLEHDRTRSVLFRYAWKSFRGSYKKLARWLAVRAFQDFPDATEVRVRWLKQQTPSPREVRAGDEPPVKPFATRTFTPSDVADLPGPTP